MTSVTNNTERRRYEIEVDGRVAGFAAYQRAGSIVELTHTEIEPGHEGEGLGSTLVRQALDDVRREGLAVRPFCPFVRAWIGKHPEYADLVPPTERDMFGLAVEPPAAG